MRKRHIPLSILLLGLFYQAESLPTNRSAAQENQSANSQSSTPAIQKPLPDQETAASGSNAEPTTDKITKAEWVQIGINAFIALIVFWQAWLYRQQSNMMKRQLWETYLTERAYMALRSIEIVGMTDSRGPTFYWRFLNAGKSPAWNFNLQIKWTIGPSPVIREWNEARAESTVFVAAGQTAKGSTRADKRFPPEAITAIEENSSTLFVQIDCRYLDFKNRRREARFPGRYDTEKHGFVWYVQQQDYPQPN
jgi:hypothetical protein